MIKVDARKSGAAAAVALLLMLLAVLALVDVFFAHGVATWGLYGAIVAMNLAFVLGLGQKPRKLDAGLLALASMVTFAGCVAAAFWASGPVVEEVAVLKPVFMLFASILLAALAALKFKGVEPHSTDIVPAKVDTADENSPSLGEKVSECYSSCGIIFLTFAILLAAVHSIMFAAETARYYPGDDAFFEIQGHQIFARCQGEGIPGEPTILFSSGLGGNSLDFSWVQRNLSAAGFRTCSYDRAGSGQSAEFGVRPRTSISIASEEYDLLEKLEIDEFVYVGHSFFGFNSRILHRDLVQRGEESRIKGLVFIDQVNPNVTEQCDPNVEYSAPFIYRFGLATADMGLVRLLEGLFSFATMAGQIHHLPEDVRDEYIANTYKMHYVRTVLDEWAAWGVSCSAVKNLAGEEKNFDFPVRIVLPSHGIHKDNLEGGAEMANLSPDGRVIWVNDTRATHLRVLFDLEFAEHTINAVHELIGLV